MKKFNREVEAILKAPNLDKLKKKLQKENYNSVYNSLFDVLNRIIHQSTTGSNSFELYEVGMKIFDFMDEIIKLNDTDIDIKKLNGLKTFIIGNIKKYDKQERIKNRKVSFLKEAVNRIENIELNIRFNVENDTVAGKYNIIKHILLNIKNMSYSTNLIKDYTYLINAYNISNGNIINDLVDNFLFNLESYRKNESNYDLSYIEFIIYEIMHIEKIKIDKKDITNNITKITNYYSKINNNDKDKIYPFINHIINTISDNDYEISTKTLDELYNINNNEDKIENINFIIKEEPSKEDYIISIDCEDNYNKDDALSITKENDFYRLKIFISDPNNIFEMNSNQMKEARKLTQSIYLCDKVINMFPIDTIKNCLSLEENQKRYSRVYTYDIDKYGKITNFNIQKKIIKVDRNLTYNGVDNIFIDDIKDDKLDDTIMNLLDIKSLILNKKVLSEINNNSILNSNNLLEVLMVFNNQQVAQYFSKNNLPFIYKSHIFKEQDDVLEDKFSDFKIYDKNVRKMIKSIGELNESAFYSDTIKKHDGLKLNSYCSSTSPNRRYADILVNECEDKFYFNNISDKDYYDFENYLKQEIDYLNQRNLQITDYYRRYTRTLKK